MDVAVGSTNPVKRAAVERALAAVEPTVETVAVDSGVAEQPTSLQETVEGAKTRARRALAESKADTVYGIGCEGGVAQLEDVPGRSLIMWAAVTDGDRVECGGGPSIRLPDDIATAIAAGDELGPVIDRICETENTAENQGAIGILTDGMIDRTEALATAVACAFGPFRADERY